MSPHLIVSLDHITENASRTVELCRPYGIEVVGITKGVCGRPEIARAMLEGGIETLGDARLDNIARMREAGIEAPMLLVRSPGLSEIGSCVELAECSLNADLGVLRALSREAVRTGRRHGVILMVDLNTGREGFDPAELMEVCETAASESGLRFYGLGIYFHFASSADHQAKGLERLVSLASEVGAALGMSLPVISGGSTNAFHTLVVNGSPNPGIRQLRIGTAILLGLAASVGPVPIAGFHQDTFLLQAELIEVKKREKRIGILSLGKMDTDPDFLFCTAPGVRVLGATSDHTLLDLTEMPETPRVGDRLTFRLGYPAMSRLMASPYTRVTWQM